MTQHSPVPDLGRLAEAAAHGPVGPGLSRRMVARVGSIALAGICVGLLAMPSASPAEAAGPDRSRPSLAATLPPPTPYPQPPIAARPTPTDQTPMPTPQAPAVAGIESFRAAADAHRQPVGEADGLVPGGSKGLVPGIAEGLVPGGTEGLVPGGAVDERPVTGEAPSQRVESASALAARQLGYDRSLIYSSAAGLMVATIGLLLVGSRRRQW